MPKLFWERLGLAGDLANNKLGASEKTTFSSLYFRDLSTKSKFRNTSQKRTTLDEEQIRYFRD